MNQRSWEVRALRHRDGDFNLLLGPWSVWMYRKAVLETNSTAISQIPKMTLFPGSRGSALLLDKVLGHISGMEKGSIEALSCHWLKLFRILSFCVLYIVYMLYVSFFTYCIWNHIQHFKQYTWQMLGYFQCMVRLVSRLFRTFCTRLLHFDEMVSEGKNSSL